MISLYLGGARSGKSGLAEQFLHEQTNICERDHSCEQNNLSEKGHIAHVISYVATATMHPTMAERIALHQARRPSHWHCIEEPLDLIGVLEGHNSKNHWIMIDCLTLWLTNQLMSDHHLPQQCADLVTTLQHTQANVILVSTEVGLGLILDDDMSLSFAIASGELHQSIANIADRVAYCQSGMALMLKDSQPC
jgi:adenosylcobinamide kinase/adenosylcobinamide-phosphate guanylyltransferase